MVLALIFPGQGSQSIGMGAALASSFSCARDVFAQVDEALGQNLSKLMFEGPEAELTLTANAQPALMAVSIAALRVLEDEAGLILGRDVHCVAGHSLGEYSALCAAGSIDLADTARLLRLRGQAMQRAVSAGEGAMAALLGLDYETGFEVAAEAQKTVGGGAVCQIANDNGGGQVVASGSKAAVEKALEIAKTRGARRGIMLPVSAPFHCSLMQPAADEMAQALTHVMIHSPKVPVIANVTAAAVTQPAEIRRLLVEQVTGTVRWRECVGTMAASGVDVFLEVGAGKVLSGLIKRLAENARGMTLGTPDDLVAWKAFRSN